MFKSLFAKDEAILGAALYGKWEEEGEPMSARKFLKGKTGMNFV